MGAPDNAAMAATALATVCVAGRRHRIRVGKRTQSPRQADATRLHVHERVVATRICRHAVYSAVAAERGVKLSLCDRANQVANPNVS